MSVARVVIRERTPDQDLMERIIEVVGKLMRVPKVEIFSERRFAARVQARQVAMYILLRRCNLPTSTVTGLWGQDHKMARYAVTRVEDSRATDPRFAKLLLEIEEEAERVIEEERAIGARHSVSGEFREALMSLHRLGGQVRWDQVSEVDRMNVCWFLQRMIERCLAASK